MEPQHQCPQCGKYFNQRSGKKRPPRTCPFCKGRLNVDIEAAMEALNEIKGDMPEVQHKDEVT